MTVSTTWMTPLLAAMSVFTTRALLITTVLPLTWMGSESPLTAFAELTFKIPPGLNVMHINFL